MDPENPDTRRRLVQETLNPVRYIEPKASLGKWKPVIGRHPFLSFADLIGESLPSR
jgi:hypothetical protein